MKRLGYVLLGVLPFFLFVGFQLVLIAMVAVVTSMGMGLMGIPVATFVILSIQAVIVGFWYRKICKEKEKVVTRQKRTVKEAFFLVVSILLLVVGVQCIAVVTEHLVQTLVFGSDYVSVIDAVASGGVEPWSVIYVWTFVNSALLGPMGEELAFRGVTLSYLERSMPFWVANVLQACLFAILHFSVTKMPQCFISGMLWGYVFRKGKSIKYPILLHVLHNTLCMVALEELVGTMESWNSVLATMGSGVCVGAGVWLFRSYVKEKELQQLCTEE